MNKKTHHFLPPVNRKTKTQNAEFSTGQLETKGVHRKREAMIKPTLQYYLILSPTDQARHLAGHNRYIKGMRTMEMKIKSELTGRYGHFVKSVS